MDLQKYMIFLFDILAMNTHLLLVYGNSEIVWIDKGKFHELRTGGLLKVLGGSFEIALFMIEEVGSLQDWQIKDSRI